MPWASATRQKCPQKQALQTMQSSVLFSWHGAQLVRVWRTAKVIAAVSVWSPFYSNTPSPIAHSDMHSLLCVCYAGSCAMSNSVREFVLLMLWYKLGMRDPLSLSLSLSLHSLPLGCQNWTLIWNSGTTAFNKPLLLLPVCNRVHPLCHHVLWPVRANKQPLEVSRYHDGKGV